MKKTEKIYQVQGNAKAHFVLATSKTKAIKAAKLIWPLEKIDFAADFTDTFSEEERNNLPDYIIIADSILSI